MSATKHDVGLKTCFEVLMMRTYMLDISPSPKSRFKHHECMRRNSIFTPTKYEDMT